MGYEPRRNLGRMFLLLALLAGCGATPSTATEPDPDTPSGNQPAEPETEGAAARAEARLALCAGQVELVDSADHERLHLGSHGGVDVFHIAGGQRGGAVIVAVGTMRPGGEDECAVQQPLAGQAPIAGRFWPGAGMVQAVLLGPEPCDPESCPATVLVRDRGRALGAMFLPGKCDRGVFLRELSWFAGQDSLQLTCHQSAGAGYRETLFILHVTAQGLAPILALETGVAEQASQEERETPGFCERRPVGSVQLVAPGQRPVVRVLDPARGEPGRDGEGTALVADFRFDPGTGGFEQITPGELVDYDARAWCKQDRAR